MEQKDIISIHNKFSVWGNLRVENEEMGPKNLTLRPKTTGEAEDEETFTKQTEIERNDTSESRK